MNQQTLDKVQAISKEYDAGLGKIVNLCKKHGMSSPYYYQVKNRIAKIEKKAAAKPGKKKYSKTAKAKFIDVPLQPENHSYKLRIFEVIVNSKDELRALMGAL